MVTNAADDLLQVYELAANNDPVVRQARAQYSATHTNLTDGRALLLPTVTMAGNTSRNTQAPTPVHSLSDGFNTHSYSLSLSQNLVNFEAWYSFQAAQDSDEQAMATLALAEQQLILRVAGAYFDVLRSQNNIRLLEAQEAASDGVMDQAQQRFDLGFAEISDVYDSQAAYSQARVARMDEENILRQRIRGLQAITGGRHQMLETLSIGFPVASAEPGNVEEWLALAERNNLSILAAEHTVASTENQARAAKAALMPTLTLNANYVDSAERDNPYAFLTGASNNSSVTLNLSIPIFRGGTTRARVRRAYYTLDANRELLEQAQRQSLVQTLDSFESIQTAVRTVEARRENIAIAQNALEATEVGVEVGTRNTVDLVQAQRTLFQAQRDYANARYDYVINTLALKQAAGILSPQDVIDLNEWLE